jgi:hypothetical protein
MSAESEVAQVWAALLGLYFCIACAVTLGCWLCIYHVEAQSMQPYLVEPTTTVQLILDDIPLRR